MKLHYIGLLGTNHSWSIVGRNIVLALDDLGHELSAVSKNGLEGVPKRIVEISRNKCNPDICIGYALPSNFSRYKIGNSKAITIYNFETTVLPKGWSRLANVHLDRLLPSSKFSHDIFVSNGVKPEKMTIIPHGVNIDNYNPDMLPFNIPGAKSFKFLNVGINHKRKGYDILFEAYANEFTSKDDVSLIIKLGYSGPVAKTFNLNVQQLWKNISSKKDVPHVVFIKDQFESMAGLYTACDAYVSASRSEGFGLTLLEAIACGLPVIAPRYGGHLDFLKDDYAMLIDTKVVHCPVEMQYWIAKPNNAMIGEPSKEHLAHLMREMYNNHEDEKRKVELIREDLCSIYSWERVALDIINVAEECLNDSV